VPLEAHLVARYEGAVIVTDHSNVDYDLLLRHSKLVVDTRNVIPGASQHRHIVAKA
jgi:UDP-N-acetyl-D-glucosamine dehydrogenase